MMKTKIRRISRRTISIVLALLMMVSMVVVGTVSTSAASTKKKLTGATFEADKRVYLVNKGNWTNAYIHLWTGSEDKELQMTKYSGTKIFSYYFSSAQDAQGFRFISTKGDRSTHWYTGWVNSNYAFTHDNSMSWQGDISKLNGTAKIVSMIDSTGSGTYTKAANANCVATVSSKNLNGGTASIDDTSGSTGSANEASCYPAYGATVNYTATASNGYVFRGFSTTNSSSLPSGVTSTKSVTSNAYNGSSNPSTVYAYFSPQTYTITYNAGANGTGTVSSTTKVHGQNATLSSSKFTRTGYTQTGWSTTDGGAKAYDLGGTYTTNSDTTLYPYWTQNTYTVKKSETGGSGTVKVGSTTITTGGVSIAHGTYTVTVTAPTGYNVSAVSIGGTAQSITPGSSVTINSVAITAAKTIAVTYALKTYTISLSETVATGGTLKVDGSAFTSGSTVEYGSHTFRVDAPIGYEISSISGIGTWTKSADETYATLGSTSITENKTISVTYKVSTTPALRVNYTGSSGAATASTGSVTTSTRHNVTVTFTNQSAMTNGSNYSVTYTKDGGSATTLISGTTSTSGGELTAKAAGTLTAGTYVYTVTVGTKTSSVTVVVNQSRTLTVNTAANVASVSGSYTNEFGQTSQTISSNGTYYFKSGTAVSVTYTAADHYQISSGNYSGSPTSDKICTPTVSEKTHTLTVNNTVCTTDVYPTSVGEVTAATVTATTEKTVGSQKYIFSGWTISGTYQVTSGSTSSNSISITATTNVTMTANYNEYRAISAAIASGSNAMISSFRITYTNTSGSSATLTNTTDTVWAKVGTVSLRVTPNSGYKIKPSVTTTDNVTKTASSFSTSYQDITGINLAGSSSATDIFTISATEDTSQSNWYIAGQGDSGIFTGWGTSGVQMSYPSGGYGGNVIQASFTITDSSKLDKVNQFKIYNHSKSTDEQKYYTNTTYAHNGSNYIQADVTDIAVEDHTAMAANMGFKPTSLGTYTFIFTVNATDDSKGTLTVIYPGLNITYKENGSAYSGTTVTLSGNPTDAKAGNTVYFTATPANGKIITGVTYTNASGTATAVDSFVDEGGTVSFTMPNVATTVNITTATAHTVNFADATHIALTAKVGSTSISTGKKVVSGTTVTFTATFDVGYELDTSNFGSTPTPTLNSSNKLVYTFSKSITSNFTASISAKLINYTLSTGSNTSYGGTVKFKKNSSSANSVTSDSSMTVESTFYPDVTANTTSGYQLDSIELRKAGTTTTISEYDSMSSGSQYSMPAYNSTLYATWSAIKPAMASISSSTSGVTVSGYTITAYAGQSIEITPAVTAASYGVISYGKGNVTGKTDALMATYNSTTKKFTFTVPEDIGSLASSTAQYQFKIRPKNSPSEVDAVWGSYKTITINVSYSATQQAYMNLKTKYDEYAGYEITSDDIESGWNTVGNVIGYGSAMDAAATAIANFPAWNATDIYSSKQTDLEGAYSRLVFKTNTIYVLSKYEHSASSYVNIFVFNNDDTVNHNPSPIFYTDTSLTTINNTARNYHMTYEGETNDHKHLYSFTYRGHQEFIIYRQSSETNTLTGGAKLTGDIDLRNTTNYPYGEYYIDVKNTDVTSSPSVTSASTFTDFSISATGADSDLMVGQCKEGATGYTVSQIQSWLGITFNGSLASTSSQTVAQTYTITGPVGRGVPTEATVDSDHNWVPLKPGRYTVSLNASLGTDERASAGATFTGSKSTVGDTQTVLDLFVAFDDIEIYADMNGNVGTPTIHFTYTDNHEQDADLPYEFDMVTGSESIYSYTISVSTLKDVYHIDLLNGAHTEGGITYRAAQVSKISIDSVDYENSNFTINREAARTGTLWLKADSSNMKTFNTIAYGSSTRTFKAVLRNGNTDTDFNNTFAEVNGTGIITDELVGDSYQYTSFYAAKDATANYDFSYTLRAKAQTDITHKDGNTTNYYYFDHWESINGTTTNTNPAEASGTDVNILKAPNYDTDADVTYVAVYKLTSIQPRVEITYKFQDYDTDDENYVYDPDKPLKDATYTKTVNWNGTTDLSTVARDSCPIIKSNYFDYTFDVSTANVTTTQSEDPNTHKTCITAELKQTPHKYKIILGSNTYKGYYQQSVELTADGSNYKWYVKDANNNKIFIGNGQTYNARFGVYQDAGPETESGVSYQYDICTIFNEPGTAAINSSIVPAHQEVYYDNDTPKVRHNFFIIDAYDNSGEFVGAGVLYATTDSSGNYRQSNAATHLASDTSRKAYINGILNTEDKKRTEYKAQTIDNVGFRYLPYSGNESIIRYSNELKAYMYTFAGENTNSASLEGQKLRVFSFFVYKDTNNQYQTVVSSMYAQVERYIAN